MNLCLSLSTMNPLHLSASEMNNIQLEQFQPYQLWLERFDARVAELEPRLIDIRRHLHAHPEPSGEEIETTIYLNQILTEIGIPGEVKRNEIGLTVDLSIGEPSEDTPLIALRADIDALRIPDEKTVPYRSQNEGIQHACGHDAHSTVVLGVALALQSLTQQTDIPTPGLRLRLIFQPAEETCQGARWMSEQNALAGVSGILGLHMEPEKPAGHANVRYGVMTANCDEVALVIHGDGGHAARPHHTADPVAAAAELVMSLYQYLPRSVDSRDPSVFSVGKLVGGYAPNVIPEQVEIGGSLRTIQSGTRKRLQDRIREIAEGIGLTSGTRIEVFFKNELPAVINNDTAVRCLELSASHVLGAKNTFRIPQPSMGGEDFAVYLQQVPGAMIRLGCAPDHENPRLLHTCRFDIDEAVLGLGVRVILRAAILYSHSLQ